MLLKARLRQIRFWRILAFAFLKRYRLRLSIIAVSLLVILVAFYKLWPKISQVNTVNIGYVGIYPLQSLPANVLSLTTQSLVTTDEAGRPVPELASHWTISDDGRTYIVFLKDNLKWHDDSPVSAKDLSIALENIKITALNDKALEFKLASPISSFPTALDKPVFKAKSFYGTGIYRIVGIDSVEDIVKKISLVSKDPSKPRVNIKFYPNQEQAKNALKIGEVKVTNITGASEFEKFSNIDVDKVVDYSEIVTIFLNNKDPLLSSPEVRQALAYAINKDFDGEKAQGPISPLSWAFNPNLKHYEYNGGRARDLLTKSQVQNPKVVLTVTPGFNDLAQKIKKDWEAIGVRTEINQSNVPVKFQALLVVNKLNPDPDQYALWHSQATTTNITNFNSKKVDKLLEDGRTIQDENSRKDIYSDFQRALVDESPAIFLYYPYKYRLTYKNVENLLSELPQKDKLF